MSLVTREQKGRGRERVECTQSSQLKYKWRDNEEEREANRWEERVTKTCEPVK